MDEDDQLSGLMTEPMRNALRQLEARAQAVLGMTPGSKDPFTILSGSQARETLRMVLHGYVEDEDLDGALAFVTTMHLGVVLALVTNPTEKGSEIGVKFSVAQTFLAGMLYERERRTGVRTGATFEGLTHDQLRAAIDCARLHGWSES